MVERARVFYRAIVTAAREHPGVANGHLSVNGLAATHADAWACALGPAEVGWRPGLPTMWSWRDAFDAALPPVLGVSRAGGRLG